MISSLLICEGAIKRNKLNIPRQLNKKPYNTKRISIVFAFLIVSNVHSHGIVSQRLHVVDSHVFVLLLIAQQRIVT